MADVSHETLYRHVYRDKEAGGDLHTNLRQPAPSLPASVAWARSARVN
jgi:hypothetical protein